MLKWKHQRPMDYFSKCIEMFGNPTALAPQKDGFAIWKTRGLFQEHILRDEDVKHCVPAPHHDFFYSSVKFFVPPNRVWDVLKISGSLSYDGLKKTLTARCGGIGANIATIYLAMLVANDLLKISDVKKDNLYPKLIKAEIMTHNEMRKEMMKMKKKNHKKYQKELKLDFAPYAFKHC
jgi:hypothetical protein